MKPSSKKGFQVIIRILFILIILLGLLAFGIYFHHFKAIWLILFCICLAACLIILAYGTYEYYIPLGDLVQHIFKNDPANPSNLNDSPRKRINDAKNRFNNEATENLLLVQAEMNALQKQINPHFLYNTLEVIRSQALFHGMSDTAEMTKALGTLFRYGIDRPGKMATLREEFNNVNDYLTIQKYRFGEKIDVIWDLKEQEKINECLLPILTVQPIVENAIHHGLESKTGKGILTISTTLMKNKLCVVITDNGTGMSEEELNALNQRLHKQTALSHSFLPDEDNSSGIALLNVDQRLKYYFGMEFGLSIQSTLGCGTSVEFSIPFV